MQSIRIVFVDLDGTLLSSSHQILDSSEYAISELIRQNIHVVVTTGRSVSGMKEAVKSLPFNLQAPISVHNGALILDRQKKIAHKVILEKEAMVALVQEARRQNIHMGFQSDFDTYIEGEMGKYEWVYKLHGIEPVLVDDLLGLDIELIKVSFYGEEDRISSLLEFYHHEADVERVSLFRSGMYYADATAKKATKLESAQWITKALDIPAEQVLAIGDQFNDIEMLQWAEVGVAMGNADKDVKCIADFVTKTNDDHGIFHALKSHGLLQ